MRGQAPAPPFSAISPLGTGATILARLFFGTRAFANSSLRRAKTRREEKGNEATSFYLEKPCQNRVLLPKRLHADEWMGKIVHKI